MSSILPGFEYDIFISYRHKDNKGDRWVSEFVDYLKAELESTFKEEISVYFDINPHDGLSETHDVNASLKQKLKCLVFIPIISRTYCDPKSFAWSLEFIPFVEQASKDQFGLKVTLPNGNVANRVLPVRIHDLDSPDIYLFESVIGGVLRSIDFVHKETGVNRQLHPKDDDIIKGISQVFYRDQINKVALAIRDIIESMKVPVSPGQLNEKKNHRKAKPGKTDSKSFRKFLKVAYFKRRINLLSWKRISMVLTGLIAAILIISLLIWYADSRKTLPVIRLTFNIPQGKALYLDGENSAVALSPDGSKMVFVAASNDTTYLYLHMFDEFDSRLILGTEGANGPFFSPDGKWVGFFSNGYLKKISLPGGPPQSVCEAKDGYQGCWGQNNTIIYEDDYKGLMLVQSSGGTPRQLSSIMKYSRERLDLMDLWPHFLPGGNEILYTSLHNAEDSHISVVSLQTGKAKVIIKQGYNAQYLETGQLVYAWKGNLLAVAFNPKEMKVTGQPAVILRGVKTNSNIIPHFSVSKNGTLAFLPGDVTGLKNRLVLVDHHGISENLNFPPGDYISPRFSPDGKNLLIANYQEKTNLWIYGMERSTISRLTDGDKEAYWGIWTPDGSRIAFNSDSETGTATNLFWKRFDGTGSVEQLVANKYHKPPQCFSIDGKYLIYTQGMDTVTGADIWIRPMSGDTTPRPFLNSRFDEFHPAISPDGKWLAYTTNEFGQDDVFVCSFPEGEHITQISTSGGYEPLWAPDGKELYYRNFSGSDIMAVTFKADPKPIAGRSVLLFQGKYVAGIKPWGRTYDITKDGKQFLMIELEKGKPAVTQVSIILNWFEDLKQIVPND